MAKKYSVDDNYTGDDRNDTGIEKIVSPNMPEESTNILTAFLLERETQTQHVTGIDQNAPVHSLLNTIDTSDNNEQEAKNSEKSKKTYGIFVAGDFGQGKSTTINWLIGQALCPTGDTFESVTKQPAQITLQSSHGNTLNIYDTPGFQSDELENIRCLNRVMLSEFTFNVVLFVQNILNNRINPTLLEEMKVYKYDYDLPIILVLNQASPNTKAKLKIAWLRNLVDTKYDKIIDALVILDTVNVDNQEVPVDIHHLVETIGIFIKRQSTRTHDLSTRSGKIEERLRRIQALKYSKYGMISVGVATTAAVAVGLSPVPFSDAFLLVPIEISMFAGICAAFKLKLGKGILIWLLSTGVGASGIGFGILKLVNSAVLKLIPGVNIGAMVVDGVMAFTGTLALGISLIAVLRILHIRGVDLNRIDDQERKKLLKDLFSEEVKEKWKLLFRSNKEREVLQAEMEHFEGVAIDTNLTTSESFDIDKLLKTKEQVLKQEKLQKSERLSKLDQLQREKKTLKDVCCICLRSSPNIFTQPCGHCCMCESDYMDYIRTIKVCPIPDCLEKISSFSKI